MGAAPIAGDIVEPPAFALAQKADVDPYANNGTSEQSNDKGDGLGEGLKAIPKLQDEVRQLKSEVPQLQSDILDVRRDMQLVLNAVRSLQCNPSRLVASTNGELHRPSGGEEGTDNFLAEASSKAKH